MPKNGGAILATLYENLKLLCDQRGIKPGKMCVEIGASKSLMTGLKAGRTKSINAETAQKIADYVGVSVDYILNGPDAALYSAAQDAVVNREFAELPIETRAAMLQGIKKDAPTGNADERDLDASLISRLVQLSPEEKEKVDAFVQGILASR